MAKFVDIEKEEEIKEETVKKIEKSRKPYSVWTVGGKDYKLRLTAAAIKTLEKDFKQNLLSALFPDGEVLPPVMYMLRTVQIAAGKYEHGIDKEKIEELYDEYVDEGGTFETFYSDVITPLFAASGFFSMDQMEAMQKAAEEAKTNL